MAAKALKVTVIGDSYSAGNGAGDYGGPKGCYRSDSNWGKRYVNGLVASGFNVTYANRACSGAVMSDITDENKLGSDGQDEVTRPTVIVSDRVVGKDDARARAELDRLGLCTSKYRDDEVFHVTPESATAIGAATLVRFRCVRRMLPQLTAVSRDTDLVMFSMGGNDVNFSKIVEQCFVIGMRDPHSCRQLVEGARDSLPSVRNALVDKLRAVKGRMRPDAKLALKTYPYLERYDEFTIGNRILGVGTRYNAGREIRSFQRAADDDVRAAVDLVNGEGGTHVVLVDEVKGRFAGREPDARLFAVNADAWLHGISTWPKMANYHYNPDGHREIARIMSEHGDFGAAAPPEAYTGGAIDIAFVIDTTGSMGSSINSVKEAARGMVAAIAAKTTQARFALIDYRDFPERTGSADDYPAKLQQDFTSSSGQITSAIDDLELGDGGDIPETMFSGLNTAYELTWRPGVKKMTVVLADAPALSPEPVTGFTGDQMIAKSLAIDPAEAHFVDVSGADSQELQDIAARTNGGVYQTSPSQAAEQIEEVIDASLDKPYAWAAGPYVTRTGEPVALDGTGSYGLTSEIIRWEWDVDNDGTYDIDTSGPTASHTYTSAYDGLVGLRVTDASGKVALATAVASASPDGDEIAQGQDNCPTVANPGQEDYDGDGTGDECDATSGIPTQDKPGVDAFHGDVATSSGAGSGAGSSQGPSLQPQQQPAGGGAGTVIARPGRVRVTRVAVARNRRSLRLTVRCLRTTGTCRGTISVKVGKRTLLGTYRVAAKRNKAIAIKVAAKARRSFKPGRRVTLTVTLRPAGEAAVRRKMSVRVPRRR